MWCIRVPLLHRIARQLPLVGVVHRNCATNVPARKHEHQHLAAQKIRKKAGSKSTCAATTRLAPWWLCLKSAAGLHTSMVLMIKTVNGGHTLIYSTFTSHKSRWNIKGDLVALFVKGWASVHTLERSPYHNALEWPIRASNEANSPNGSNVHTIWLKTIMRAVARRSSERRAWNSVLHFVDRTFE